jgi:hypothetical protein
MHVRLRLQLPGQPRIDAAQRDVQLAGPAGRFEEQRRTAATAETAYRFGRRTVGARAICAFNEFEVLAVGTDPRDEAGALGATAQRAVTMCNPERWQREAITDGAAETAALTPVALSR